MATKDSKLAAVDLKVTLHGNIEEAETWASSTKR